MVGRTRWLLGLLAGGVLATLCGCEGAFSTLVNEHRNEPQEWEIRMNPQFLSQGEANKQVDLTFTSTLPEGLRQRFLLNPTAFIIEIDVGPNIQIKRYTRDWDTGAVALFLTVPAETPAGEVYFHIRFISGREELRGAGKFFVLYAQHAR